MVDGLQAEREHQHLTSAEAERLLAQRGVKPKDRKAKLDAAAAAVILQGHLEERRARGLPAERLD